MIQLGPDGETDPTSVRNVIAAAMGAAVGVALPGLLLRALPDGPYEHLPIHNVEDFVAALIILIVVWLFLVLGSLVVATAVALRVVGARRILVTVILGLSLFLVFALAMSPLTGTVLPDKITGWPFLVLSMPVARLIVERTLRKDRGRTGG